MRLNFLLPILISMLLAMGCASHTAPLPAYAAAEPDWRPDDVLTESLFQTKDRTLSEADIQRLLDGKVLTRDSLRIAVFNYRSKPLQGYHDYYVYSEDYLHFRQAYMDSLIAQLSLPLRVRKVSLMPTLMADQSASMAQLREAAVRLQADVLLIFQVRSEIYANYRMFAKDEAKAFASCEAMLLDVRTGMVPYSDVLTRDHFTEKQEGDANAQETQKRAEQVAVLEAIDGLGSNLAKYLSGSEAYYR